FEKAGDHDQLNAGIMKWLLGPKNEHAYNNSKSTAAVVNAMLSQQGSTAAPQTLSADLSGQKLSITNDLLNGKLFAFIRSMGTAPEKLTIQKQTAAAASGSVMNYYFTSNPVTENNNSVSIKRKHFVFDNNGKEWKEIDALSKLIPGDRIRTTLYIETTKQLRYVFNNEPRSACQEPKNALSGYQYGNRFSYYSSVTDAGYRFFAESIPSGSSEISYETVVSQKGMFFNGITGLQLMYKPDVKAYANGIVITSE
ncbi:MAG TPA: hypothetical protein VKH37_03235, partial [Ferruginibacter sp.]|nr:hypothetical protein [Ferruginibacter sp.]